MFNSLVNTLSKILDFGIDSFQLGKTYVNFKSKEYTSKTFCVG